MDAVVFAAQVSRRPLGGIPKESYRMSFSIFLVPAVWLLKSVAYVIAFRIRKIDYTYLGCLVIAGASLLVGLIPIPLPGIVGMIAGMGLAVFLTMHYTGVPLIPDGLFIPLGVEVVFGVGIWAIQEMK
jgi:hypothetical protein